MSFKAFLFLITICVAKSEESFENMCKNDYRDENKNQIDVLEYCANKLCIEKCCGPGEMIRYKKKLHSYICTNIKEWFERKKKVLTNPTSLYNSINVLSSLDVNNKSKKDYVFVYNHRNFQNCTSEQSNVKDYEILENGSLRLQDDNKKWTQIEKLEYCIDYRLYMLSKKERGIKIIIMPTIMDPQETKAIEAFEIVAILISSFFLMLVLVVYCLLPDQRKLVDLVLMAYTFSLLFAFVNKLIQTFIKWDPPKGFCTFFSPVVYFGFMSSIFWLSAISFEVSRGLRSLLIIADSKHAVLLKFKWYALYAWGTPLLITAIVTTLDNIDNLNLPVETPFKDCLVNGNELNVYYKIPIGILIFINIVLFVRTVYNLKVVKDNVNKRQDSKSSKQNDYKFATYAKLSVMMGVSWWLELLPEKENLWPYILINSYNLLTGVTIFYWYVCEKKKLVPLCKKFNIQNNFVKKWESELSRTKSEITRTTGVPSSFIKDRSKDQNPEIELLKTCPIEESTIV